MRFQEMELFNAKCTALAIAFFYLVLPWNLVKCPHFAALKASASPGSGPKRREGGVSSGYIAAGGELVAFI